MMWFVRSSSKNIQHGEQVHAPPASFGFLWSLVFLNDFIECNLQGTIVNKALFGQIDVLLDPKIVILLSLSLYFQY